MIVLLLKLKKIDWGIVVILAMLMVISVIVVYSATFGTKFAGSEIKTAIFFVVGFIALLAIAIFDYRLLLKGSLYFYGVGIVLLVAVYFTAGINGASGWFQLPGGLQFQPAEMMKLCLILTVAYFLGKREGNPLKVTSDLLPIFVTVFVPFLLVLIQPDLGNAIIYFVILLGMLWIGNVKYTHVLIGIATLAAFLALFFYLFNTYNMEIKEYLDSHNKGHWYKRINTFMDPENASSDDKLQSKLSKIAVGSGGLSGDGFMQGTSKKSVPYTYSDSIFVIIGEEFGFVGASVLLLLYFLLIYRMILISIQCYDKRGAYIIVGIVSMFVFQIFENVGMMIGLMPITGITLPFISYGGTSLLLNMICVGVVLSIKVHQEKYEMF